MRFIRVGTRIINTRYLIDSDRCLRPDKPPEDGIPDGEDLRMICGRKIVLDPDEAEAYRRAMLRIVPALEGSPYPQADISPAMKVDAPDEREASVGGGGWRVDLGPDPESVASAPLDKAE